MDGQTMLMNMIMDILITFIGYLLVPATLAVTDKKYDIKTIKRINIINCAVAWVLFRVLQAALGSEVTAGAGPLFLWGSISYIILKKYCLKSETPIAKTVVYPSNDKNPIHINVSECRNAADEYGSGILLQQNPEPTEQTPSPEPKPYVPPVQPVITRLVSYCVRCGGVLDPVTHKCGVCGKRRSEGVSGKTVGIVVLSVLLAITISVTFLGSAKYIEEYEDLTHDNAFLKSKIAEQRDEIVELKNRIQELEGTEAASYQKLKFFEDNVVFILDDGTNLYHKYECELFVDGRYWAHNVEYAEYQGYVPCPLCH